MNYLRLLKHSYVTNRDGSSNCGVVSKLEFLSAQVFGFTTYHSEMSELFATKALAVSAAISSQTTFEFVNNPDNHLWFLMMCNLPFFSQRIEWGSSIRGAWWRHDPLELESGGLWEGRKQLLTIKFTEDEWLDFISALIDFST